MEHYDAPAIADPFAQAASFFTCLLQEFRQQRARPAPPHTGGDGRHRWVGAGSSAAPAGLPRSARRGGGEGAGHSGSDGADPDRTGPGAAGARASPGAGHRGRNGPGSSVGVSSETISPDRTQTVRSSSIASSLEISWHMLTGSLASDCKSTAKFSSLCITATRSGSRASARPARPSRKFPHNPTSTLAYCKHRVSTPRKETNPASDPPQNQAHPLSPKQRQHATG